MRLSRSTQVALALACALALAPATAAVAAPGAPFDDPVGSPTGDAGLDPGIDPGPIELPPSNAAEAAAWSDLAGVAAAPSPSVVPLGSAPVLAEAEGLQPTLRVVGITARAAGGAWMTARDGGVFSLGGAPFLGSMGAIPLNKPVVGLTGTTAGAGYWLVASDGGIFSFGDAQFYGSTGAMRLNQPVVGMAATPTGRGYWLVASDGGIFSFGDAVFQGARPRPAGSAPVVGIARSAGGAGYLVVGADGDLDAFGDAPALPDVAAASLGTGSVVGVAITPAGTGAWLAVGRVNDAASVSQPRGMSAAVAGAAVAAGRAAGGQAAIIHSGTLGLVGVTRAGAPVQVPPAGMRYPMASVALDVDAAAALDGPQVAAVLAAGQVVMGQTSASLRGAQTGDDVDLIGWDGVTRRYHVGLVAPDDVVGWSELVLSTTTARAMGFDRPAWVELWDFRSRTDIDNALTFFLPRNVLLDVDRSWDPAEPDGVLPSSLLKATFGEFAYVPVGGDGAISQEAAWRSANIRSESVPIVGTITCHRLIFAPLRGALNELQARGLGGLIDGPDSRLGGCYAPREIRSGGGTTGGSISRHSWGLAVDLNPSSNPFGGTPRMDPRVVEVFRRWGFAWGGTWTLPDGMHFELVRAG
jgi:hypothetical protein